MFRDRRAALTTLVVLPACFLLGCGQGPTLYPVTGRVTFEGQPVTAGTILFRPERGPIAIGQLSADGSYELSTDGLGRGAPAGRYQIAFSPPPAEFVLPADEINEIGPPPEVRPQPFLPPQFLSAQRSGLEAEVRTDGDNTLNFDL